MPLGTRRLGVSFLFLVKLCFSGIILSSLCASEDASEQDASDQGALVAETQFSESEILYVKHIQSILLEKCLGCHGVEGRDIEGGFDVRSLQSLMLGGDSGEPSIVIGKPQSSPIYLAASRDSVNWSAMPPKDAERLGSEDLELLARWIETGAHWPTAERVKKIESTYQKAWSSEEGIKFPTSGGLTDEWTNRKYLKEDLWAYQSIATVADATASEPQSSVHPVPTRKDGSHSEIDRLLSQRRPKGLSIAGRADRRTLLRRLSYDLTGLPPTFEEVQAFCMDTRSDETVYGEAVDRLLKSEHYGERMAQHWLDVVRYADSSGFANDFERGNAWRYRDYVVRSFNHDKAYDQFIIEQIAGDELVAEGDESLSQSEAMIALGFLRMGPWELTGMEVFRVARQRFLDDVTNSVGEVFLGHSLQCARCHDHKFDPIPTRDYYSVQAVFATTQQTERQAAFSPFENQEGFEEQRYLRQKEQQHAKVLRGIDEILLDNALTWYQNLNPMRGEAFEKWKQEVSRIQERDGLGNVFSAARNAMKKAKFDQDEYPPRHVGFTPQQFGAERVARKGIQRLQWEFDRYQPYALSVYSGKTRKINGVYAPTRLPADPLDIGTLEETHVLTGGDAFTRGDRVKPGVLSAASGGKQVEITEEIQGRRLAFAKWIASDKNPLTARVMVNRVWQWHFGTPLAGNPNNFGAKGKKPTHPELLDWLAAFLIQNDWSIKALHREILRSDAYCRSAEHPNVETLEEVDPEGLSYSVFKPRRLSAEELRDSMLCASGEMNRSVGGIPCRPQINQEVALQPRQVMGAFAAAWVPNPKPQQRHRRSLYVLRLRGLMDPMLEVFNAPSPDFSCEQRDASTITPQVFTLLNSDETYRRGLVFANRVLELANTDRDAIRICFQLAYGRLPGQEEEDDLLQHWKQLESSEEIMDVHEILGPPPLEVIREAVEENTGGRFRFIERLNSNADYVPDLNPQLVTKRMQSLAELCIVLLNSNEFVYVY